MVQPYTTRVSPVTISWLVNNYETAEGVSLPRSALYSHYQKHCTDTKQEPVNAASFGKLIRSVFLGLRTRRIGTRGNSKYHYYGIRLKASSSLTIPDEDKPPVAITSAPVTKSKRLPNDGPQPPKLTLAPHAQLPSHIKQYLGEPNEDMDDFPSLKTPKDLKFMLGEMAETSSQDFHLAYIQHCKQVQDAVFHMKYSTYVK